MKMEDIIFLWGGKKCFAKDINNIIRAMNPTWTDEQLSSHFVDEDK